MRLLHWTPCSVSCSSEDTIGGCLYVYLLLLHESKSECVFTCAHDYIYSDRALADYLHDAYWLC